MLLFLNSKLTIFSTPNYNFWKWRFSKFLQSSRIWDRWNDILFHNCNIANCFRNMDNNTCCDRFVRSSKDINWLCNSEYDITWFNISCSNTFINVFSRVILKYTTANIGSNYMRGFGGILTILFIFNFGNGGQ